MVFGGVFVLSVVVEWIYILIIIIFNVNVNKIVLLFI